ncbi:phage holin, lambda family [Avibacterium paragallinarum]|nr:phage holin, lambda family [Avibacterium paragallinarum]QZP17055.1 phage holin, lambda family [Avibacterium paragallinarum]
MKNNSQNKVVELCQKKNPDVWNQIWTFITFHLSNHNHLICAVVVAFFASLLKAFLYGKTDSPRRVTAEALLCSLIAGVMQPVLMHFHFDISLITPAGAAIGLAGTSAVRQLLLGFFKSKAGIKNE